MVGNDENSKYKVQIYRNYEQFKKALGKIYEKRNLTHKEEEKLYLLAKAELYDINIDDYVNEYNLIELEQEIDRQEALESKAQRDLYREYYASRGC